MNEGNTAASGDNSGAANSPATGMGVENFLNEVEEVNNSYKNDRKKVNLKEMTYNPKAGKLPEDGEDIRIVVPLIEGMKAYQKLDLHWNIGTSKLVVCPSQYGRPCHICDHVEELRNGPVNGANPEEIQKKKEANIEKAKKMEAKTRHFLPVVIRGKEQEGPKWWGFPKTVLNSISGLFKNKHYGDISDTYTGNDLTIKFPSDADVAIIEPVPMKTPLMGESGTPDEEKITKLRELVQPLNEVFIELPNDAIKKILDKATGNAQDTGHGMGGLNGGS